MKQIVLCIPFFLLGLTPGKPISRETQDRHDAKEFKLLFLTIGFGSNMFEMEPVFRVSGTKFVYTSEDVWISPGQSKIERDTLLSGIFRKSSIDSISNLINNLQDTTIRKLNIHVSSGSACSLEVVNDFKRITFWLHNTSDTTADQIVAILNSYIPNGLDKLHISNFKSKQ